MPSHRPLVSEFSSNRQNHTTPIRVRNRNFYSDDEKAKAIVSVFLVGNQHTVSDITGIPISTVNDWVNGLHISNKVIDMAKHYAEELAAGFDEIVKEALGNMLINLKAKKVGNRELCDLLKNAPNTIMLLRGDPNQISAVMTDEDKRAKLAALRAKTLGKDDDA